jgi:hypothetical protein
VTENETLRATIQQLERRILQQESAIEEYRANEETSSETIELCRDRLINQRSIIQTLKTRNTELLVENNYLINQLTNLKNMHSREMGLIIYFFLNNLPINNHLEFINVECFVCSDIKPELINICPNNKYHLVCQDCLIQIICSSDLNSVCHVCRNPMLENLNVVKKFKSSVMDL